jgi:hypothetical protein
MADLFTLAGSYTSSPGSGSPSGDPVINAPINEQMVLQDYMSSQYQLTDDSPAALPLALFGVNEAHVVILKVIGGPIQIRMESAAGNTGYIPVNSFFAITSQTAPFTSITLFREPGVFTIVKFFLGQRAG